MMKLLKDLKADLQVNKWFPGHLKSTLYSQ
jgi:hypothetical protein